MKSPLISTLASLLAVCAYAGPKEDVQTAAAQTVGTTKVEVPEDAKKKLGT